MLFQMIMNKYCIQINLFLMEFTTDGAGKKAGRIKNTHSSVSGGVVTMISRIGKFSGVGDILFTYDKRKDYFQRGVIYKKLKRCSG